MENFRKNRVKSFFVNESFSTICTKILSKKTGACPSRGESLDAPKKQMLLFVRKGETTLWLPLFRLCRNSPFRALLNACEFRPLPRRQGATRPLMGGRFFGKTPPLRYGAWTGSCSQRKKLSEKAFMIFYCDKESGDSISLVFFFLFLEVFFFGSGNSAISPFSFMRASIICPMTV